MFWEVKRILMIDETRILTDTPSKEDLPEAWEDGDEFLFPEFAEEDGALQAAPEEGAFQTPQTLTVASNDYPTRIDRYLAQHRPDLSRSWLQKLMEEGNILLNGKCPKPSAKVKSGDVITLSFPEPRQLDILPENIPLSILYEDDDLLVVDKPKQMVVHPAPGHEEGTLVNALMYHCHGKLSGINGILRPGIVHRIDQDTTGSLVVCKTDHAHRCLAAQLKDHAITRRYLAIVCGRLTEDCGTVDAPIGRHPVHRRKMAVVRTGGRHAVTHYLVLERFLHYTYIQCQLETGRTHQIRVHMANLGHPVLGDPLYGFSHCPFSLQGQTLHASVLGFIHPTTGEYMEFEAPLPAYFTDLLEKLRRSDT